MTFVERIRNLFGNEQQGYDVSSALDTTSVLEKMDEGGFPIDISYDRVIEMNSESTFDPQTSFNLEAYHVLEKIENAGMPLTGEMASKNFHDLMQQMEDKPAPTKTVEPNAAIASEQNQSTIVTKKASGAHSAFKQAAQADKTQSIEQAPTATSVNKLER